MYSFLRDGEFLQLTVEEKGKVTGFISRFGDSESDKGVFMNQFFKSGKLEEGGKLSFTTENVHGVWFEFAGNVVRGSGTKPDDEAYYVLRGSLTRFDTDADKKTDGDNSGGELRCECLIDGGRSRTRTYDPLIKSQLLYHLSYAPIHTGMAGPRARPWVV